MMRDPLKKLPLVIFCVYVDSLSTCPSVIRVTDTEPKSHMVNWLLVLFVVVVK